MKTNWLAAKRGVLSRAGLSLAGLPLAGLSMALPFSAALAAPAQPIELKSDVKVERIVTENGQQRRILAEPKVVVPGDRLVIATLYRNIGGTPLKDFVVTTLVPQGVTLEPESVGTIEVSVDGGAAWGKLAALTVADGQGGKRPAEAGDITHLRWTLATVAPGGKGTLTYYAKVR